MNPDRGDEQDRPRGGTPESLLRFLSEHRQRSQRRRERNRRLRKRRLAVAVLLAVAAALVAVGVVVWGSSGHPRSVGRTPPASTPRATATTNPGNGAVAKSGPGGSTQSVASPPVATTTLQQEAPQPRPVTVRLTATRGDSWVEIRAGSRVGQVLFEGTIRQGRSVRVRGDRFWVRFGSLGNLDLTVDGRAVHPALRGTLDTVITASGIRPAPSRTGAG